MKVLIPVEDQNFAGEIFKFVKNYKWPQDTHFKIINVYEPVFIQEAISPVAAEQLMQYMETAKKDGLALTGDLAERIRKEFSKAFVFPQTVEGFAKVVILETIKEWQPDLVVMGSHGRGALGRFFLGSVSNAVVANAKCSVMIVKLPQEIKVEETEKQKTQKSMRLNQEAACS